jgi:hypothetical protein
MGVGGQRHAPAALPPVMTRYPSYRRLGRPQGWFGRVLKISPPPGFDPRTVQLVASRYTTYSIPICQLFKLININFIILYLIFWIFLIGFIVCNLIYIYSICCFINMQLSAVFQQYFYDP